jgi:hypothetical protein
MWRPQDVASLTRQLCRQAESSIVQPVNADNVPCRIDHPILRHPAPFVESTLDRFVALARGSRAYFPDDLWRTGDVLLGHDFAAAGVRDVEEVRFDHVEAGEDNVEGSVEDAADGVLF